MSARGPSEGGGPLADAAAALGLAEQHVFILVVAVGLLVLVAALVVGLRKKTLLQGTGR